MAQRFPVRYERRTVALLGGGGLGILVLYFAVMTPLSHGADGARATLHQLDAQVSSLQQKAQAIAAGSNQLNQTYQQDLTLDQLLPPNLSATAEFVSLSRQMTASGLTITSFSSASTTPGAPSASGVTAVSGSANLQFPFSVQGTAAQISAWLRSLYAGPALITTANVRVTASTPAASGAPGSPAAGPTLIGISGTIVVWYSTTPGIVSGSSTPSGAGTTTSTVPGTGSTTSTGRRHRHG